MGNEHKLVAQKSKYTGTSRMMEDLNAYVFSLQPKPEKLFKIKGYIEAMNDGGLINTRENFDIVKGTLQYCAKFVGALAVAMQEM